MRCTLAEWASKSFSDKRTSRRLDLALDVDARPRYDITDLIPCTDPEHVKVSCVWACDHEPAPSAPRFVLTEHLVRFCALNGPHQIDVEGLALTLVDDPTLVQRVHKVTNYALRIPQGCAAHSFVVAESTSMLGAGARFVATSGLRFVAATKGFGGWLVSDLAVALRNALSNAPVGRQRHGL